MNKAKPKNPEDEQDFIFRPWITDPKTGERRYPRRSKVFKIPVRGKGRNPE